MAKKESTAEAAYYYILDFCKVFSISRTQFYREIHAGRLNLFKRGRRTMVERSEAERWMASVTPVLRSPVETNNPDVQSFCTPVNYGLFYCQKLTWRNA